MTEGEWKKALEGRWLLRGRGQTWYVQKVDAFGMVGNLTILVHGSSVRRATYFKPRAAVFVEV